MATRRLGWVTTGLALLLSGLGCQRPEGSVERQRGSDPRGSVERRGDEGVGTSAGGEPWSPRVSEQLALLAEHKRGLSPERAKLATGLLLEAERDEPGSLLAALPRFETRVRRDARNRTLVDLEANVGPALRQRVEALGGEVVFHSQRFDTLRAWLPVEALLPLTSEPVVRAVRPATRFVVRKDDTSQGDVAHRADVIRNGAGVDGSGITIGVISDGVQSLPAAQASGDLPAAPALEVLPGQAGEGDEGTAMLEIVFDLAPGATLWFATAGAFPGQMAENIEALVARGCDIIVDDILFLNEATFQDDVIAEAALAAVESGVLYFSAAGNGGNARYGTSGTWEGDYLPSSNWPPAFADTSEDWLDLHDFGQGRAYDTLTEDAPHLVALEWADPLGGAANDYDLFLLSADRQDLVAASTEPQEGTGDAFEAIDSLEENDQGRHLVVARWQGDERFVRLATHTGALEVGTNGQINGHPAVDGVFAISAVDVSVSGGVFAGGAENPVEPFVSDGPRRVFFASDGSPLVPFDFSSTGGELRRKPDFSAADGVAVTTPGFSPFHGTSAAAPHAAALAALLLEAQPRVRALDGRARSDAIRELLAAFALDIEDPGFDDLSGEGIVMADAALEVCRGAPDGTACDDRNACTASSACQDERCVGTTPTECNAPDPCRQLGECNPDTGECEHPPAPDGTPCEPDSACTLAASCQSGLCVARATVSCPAADDCHEASRCDPATGACSERERRSNADGCDDEPPVGNGGAGVAADAGGEPSRTAGRGGAGAGGAAGASAGGQAPGPAAAGATGRPGPSDAGGVEPPGSGEGGLDGQATARPSKFDPVTRDAGRSVDAAAPSDEPDAIRDSRSGCDCRLQPTPAGSGLLALFGASCLVLLRRATRRATFRRVHPCVGRPKGPC